MRILNIYLKFLYPLYFYKKLIKMNNNNSGFESINNKSSESDNNFVEIIKSKDIELNNPKIRMLNTIPFTYIEKNKEVSEDKKLFKEISQIFSSNPAIVFKFILDKIDKNYSFIIGNILKKICLQ